MEKTGSEDGALATGSLSLAWSAWSEESAKVNLMKGTVSIIIHIKVWNINRR
jgi:hypothetical protein